ncbi:MAG: hypothetical protein IEMM0008_0134 [bacterium]|nr:MAG: hypothetical protein IEMM0008_0134 [bacterium]
MKNCLLVLALIVSLTACGGNSAKDDGGIRYKDNIMRTNDVNTFDKRIKPYVAMARKSYPKAKKRYLKGLPKKYKFFVTIRIYDEKGNFEQVFVRVRGITNGRIMGRIANKVTLIKRYRQGDRVTAKEKDIYDWVIVKANGKEEGNFVGRYIDAYQGRLAGLIIRVTIKRNGRVKKARFSSAVSQQKQDVSYIIPARIKRKAERVAMKMRFKRPKKQVVRSTFVLYNIQKDVLVKKK